MTDKEALTLALEALERGETKLRWEAIKAIKEALAQPEMRPDEISTDELIYMNGLYDGMKQERALWTLSKLGQEIEAQPEQEPTHWHVIDPTGNVVATEKDAIHGWARLGGFKPTLEVLLAHHDSGWRVVPAPPPPQRTWVGLTDDDCFEALKAIDSETKRLPLGFSMFAANIQAKLKEKNFA